MISDCFSQKYFCTFLFYRSKNICRFYHTKFKNKDYFCSPPSAVFVICCSPSNAAEDLRQVVHPVRSTEKSRYRQDRPGSVQSPVKSRCAHGCAHREREGEGREQRLGGQLYLLQLGLLQSLGLGPAVLKPDLDLGLCEVQGAGELGSLRDGQVLFLTELPLQGEELGGGEGGPGFPVVLVFPQVALGRAGKSCRAD